MPEPIDYAALAKKAGAVSSTPPPAASTAPGGVDYAALAKQAGAISSTPAPAPAGPVERFATGVYESTVEPLVNAVAHPIDTVTGLAKQAVGKEDLDAIAAAVKSGDYKSAALSLAKWTATRLPETAGIMSLFEASKPAVEKVKQGDYAGAAGNVAGTAASIAAPELLKTTKVPLIPSMGKANPAEAAALDYLSEKGAAVPAGARTNNAFVKNIGKAADSTPIGAAVAQNAALKNTAVLKRTAAELVADSTPEISAESHYGNFRAVEDHPSSVREVPTGQMDELGQPKTAPMPMPVHVGMMKDWLVPVYEEMQWMPAADRNASAGYQAVKKIVEGPEYIPASQAEIGLSGLKSMAREGAGRAAGIAKMIVPQLQDLIDGTVRRIGGGNAVESLQQGRKAAAAEIGRDWLTQTFKKAEAEGGFNREYGIWSDWTRLGDEAKQTIFSPAQVANLDRFFLGVKKLSENPNPSGTAIVGVSTGSTALVLTNPATGIPITIGAGVLSKILRTRAGVKLLTNGMKVPLKAPGAALLFGQIAKLAGDDAKPAQQQ